MEISLLLESAVDLHHHIILLFVPRVQSMVCWLHQRGESALRKRQRGDQWWGIRGTGPILGAGNSELLITVAYCYIVIFVIIRGT